VVGGSSAYGGGGCLSAFELKTKQNRAAGAREGERSTGYKVFKFFRGHHTFVG
jgi:hypothetical protein